MNSNIFIIAFLLMNIGLTAPVFASQPLGSLVPEFHLSSDDKVLIKNH
ncbi:hypothetical protein [Shewanella sp.]|nr:hypothetical protein [Shewanella sp.]NRB22409.1 hypothetical protein [Shewanella sp.]